MIFTAVGNKIRPFDLSAYDFQPLTYTAGNTTLAAIFYLEAMRMSHKPIWGLPNIANPPNFSGAADRIAGFPRFNGQPYYAFTAVDPGAFFAYLGGPYRPYYLNDLYQTLLDHLQVLMETGGRRADARALIQRLIISQPSYHPYFVNPGLLATLAAPVDEGR